MGILLEKPPRDHTHPFVKLMDLKGLMHMLNASVIHMKVSQDFLFPISHFFLVSLVLFVLVEDEQSLGICLGAMCVNFTLILLRFSSNNC